MWVLVDSFRQPCSSKILREACTGLWSVAAPHGSIRRGRHFLECFKRRLAHFHTAILQTQLFDRRPQPIVSQHGSRSKATDHDIRHRVEVVVLRHIALSIAFPISQVVHAFVPLASWIILGESINRLRGCGIALVLLGLAVVAKPVARLEERL